MINPSLNLDKLKKEYAEKGRIYLENFLIPDIAEALLVEIQKIDAFNLWFQAHFGNPRFISSAATQEDRLHQSFAYSYSKFPLYNQSEKEILSYDCRRYMAHLSEAQVKEIEREIRFKGPIGKLVSDFNSGPGKTFVENLTSKTFSEDSLTCFAAKYSSMDFNTVHTDYMPNRQVTYVYYLTKNWMVHWGGNLVILDKNAQKILEAYSPTFNSVVIFDVPLHHAVLPISSYCNQTRYTLSGWFHKYESR